MHIKIFGHYSSTVGVGFLLFTTSMLVVGLMVESQK